MLHLIFILLTQLINETNFTVDFQVTGRDGRRLLPELQPGRTRFINTSRVQRRLREHNPDPGWKIRVLIDGKLTGIELDPEVLTGHVRVVFRLIVDGVGSGIVLCVLGVPENCSDYVLRCRFIGCMRKKFWDGRDAKLIDRSDAELPTKLRNLEGDHCEGLDGKRGKRTEYALKAWWGSNNLVLEVLAGAITSFKFQIYASSRKEGRKGSDRPINPPAVNNCKTKSPPPSPKVADPHKRPSKDYQPLMRYGDQTSFDDHENGTNTLIRTINGTDAVGEERPRRDGPRPLEGSGRPKSSVDNEDSTKDSFVHGLLFVLALIIVGMLFKLPLLM